MIDPSAVPPWVWIFAAALALLFVVTATVLLCRRRKDAPAPASATEAKKLRADRRIDAALMTVIVPGIGIVMAAYAVCTFEGMVAFAQQQLGWGVDINHEGAWLRFVPWATFDAAGVIFTLLRIYSVRKRRFGAARQAGRAVAAAMIAAAGVQLSQGGEDHKWAAGAFLGALAIFGGYALHTFIEAITDKKVATEQEEKDAANRKRPEFGDRWFFAPIETLLVLRCLSLYPLPKGVEPTVENALKHRKKIRGQQIAERDKLGFGWFPLVRASSASAAMDLVERHRERGAAEALAAVEREAAAKAAQIAADAAEEIRRLAARSNALEERLRRVEAERDAAVQQAEQNRNQVGHASQAVEAKDALIARLRGELADAARQVEDHDAARTHAEQQAAAATLRAELMDGRVPRQDTDGELDSGPIEDAARRWLDGRPNGVTAQQAAEEAGITEPWGDALRARITRAYRRLEKARTAAAK